MKNWLVFDAMGVVYEVGDDTRDLLIPYIKRLKPQLDQAFINDLYIKASLGHISHSEFWQLQGFENWQEVEKDYLDSSITLDNNFIKAISRLSRDYHIAMLSNDIGEWSAYLRQRFGLDKLFKAAVISGDVGFRKPDERIFEMLLKKTHAAPENCIFFDDRVANLVPARKLGFKAVLFNRERIDPEGFDSVNGFDEIADFLRAL
jgi:putative hydrolase of the HAD superfamily